MIRNRRYSLPTKFGKLPRITPLLEVLLHGGNTVGSWTAQQIREAVLAAFPLSPQSYGLNQLRCDLRKLKGHGLVQRDGNAIPTA